MNDHLIFSNIDILRSILIILSPKDCIILSNVNKPFQLSINNNQLWYQRVIESKLIEIIPINLDINNIDWKYFEIELYKTNYNYQSVFDNACSLAMKDIILLLINDYGIEIAPENNTPMNNAIINNHKDIVQLLLEYKFEDERFSVDLMQLTNQIFDPFSNIKDNVIKVIFHPKYRINDEYIQSSFITQSMLKILDLGDEKISEILVKTLQYPSMQNIVDLCISGLRKKNLFEIGSNKFLNVLIFISSVFSLRMQRKCINDSTDVFDKSMNTAIIYNKSEIVKLLFENNNDYKYKITEKILENASNEIINIIKNDYDIKPLISNDLDISKVLDMTYGFQ